MGRRHEVRQVVGVEALEGRICLAGSGWDGPGQGSASLTYYIENAPAVLGQAATNAAIATALNAWSSVANIRFTPTSTPNLPNSLDISFTRIDGPGGTLAQAYYPFDVNPGMIAGDVEFDSSEVWEVGNGRGGAAHDLVYVAVHEIGHALGLDHSSVEAAIMFPTVSADRAFPGLHSSDIEAILALYAPATGPGGGDSTDFATAGVVNPQTATWFLRNVNASGVADITPFAFGAPGWTPVAGDWDGDGSTTIGTVDPTNPGGLIWFLRNAADNIGAAGNLTPFAFGAPGWIPVIGDWDGNGTETAGVYDPSSSTFYLRNSNGPVANDYFSVQFGQPGWKPVVGDWDGDGVDTIGVVDPLSSRWLLRNTNTPGSPSVTPFVFGAPGWTPVVGDWDGDGDETIGLVDPMSMTWFLRNENTSGSPDVQPFSYGMLGGRPVVGDWAMGPTAPAFAPGSPNRSTTPLTGGGLQASAGFAKAPATAAPFVGPTILPDSGPSVAADDALFAQAIDDLIGSNSTRGRGARAPLLA